MGKGTRSPYKEVGLSGLEARGPLKKGRKNRRGPAFASTGFAAEGHRNVARVRYGS